MSKLEAYLGNEEFKQAAGALLAAGRLPHALLLAAPDGCGRSYAARCLAADYLYPQGGNGAQAVVRGQSPEMIVIEGEGKSGQISVASVRAARANVHLSSLSAGGRVVHIRDAHRMTTAAANALLKVLEEPPENVVFLLTAPSASSLPLTIQSRCTLYALCPVGRPVCEEYLLRHLPLKADAGIPALLSAVYGGRIGLCLRAMRVEGRIDILNDALLAAQAASRADRYALLCIFARYEGRAEGDRRRREELLADMSDILDASLRGVSIPGQSSIRPGMAALLLEPLAAVGVALQGNAAPKITFAALVIQLHTAAARVAV